MALVGRMTGRLFLAGAGSALSLAAAEGVVRWVAPVPVEQAAGTTEGHGALYGWALIPNGPDIFRDPDTGETFWFQLNTAGWRDVEHAVAKPPGTVRILFVGDSYTYAQVEFERAYFRLLQREFVRRGHDQVEILAMGVGGWGLDQELEALKREGVRYAPDLVVYQFCRNDQVDNMMPDDRVKFRPGRYELMFDHKPFRYYVDAEGKLLRATVEGVGPVGRSFGDALAGHSAFAWRIRDVLERLRGGPRETAADEDAGGLLERGEDETPAELRARVSGAPPRSFAEDSWLLQRELMSEMQRVAAAAGARFMVLAVSKPGVDVRRHCQEQGWHLFVPPRRYPKYRNDSHLNAEGNKQLAKDLMADLMEWDVLQELLARTDGG